MQVFFHFSVAGFSNSYLLGPEDGGEALLIDPGVMDVQLLKLIENNHFYVKSVLITHAHESHTSGLKTLLKVYDAEIYAGTDQILDFNCRNLSGTSQIDINGYSIRVIPIAGHSTDSLVFLIGSMLFTGDVLGAGRVGSAPNQYAKLILRTSIKDELFSLPADYAVFPGHGPPTTLEAERAINPALLEK